MASSASTIFWSRRVEGAGDSNNALAGRCPAGRSYSPRPRAASEWPAAARRDEIDFGQAQNPDARIRRVLARTRWAMALAWRALRRPEVIRWRETAEESASSIRGGAASATIAHGLGERAVEETRRPRRRAPVLGGAERGCQHPPSACLDRCAARPGDSVNSGRRPCGPQAPGVRGLGRFLTSAGVYTVAPRGLGEADGPRRYVGRRAPASSTARARSSRAPILPSMVGREPCAPPPDQNSAPPRPLTTVDVSGVRRKDGPVRRSEDGRAEYWRRSPSAHRRPRPRSPRRLREALLEPPAGRLRKGAVSPALAVTIASRISGAAPDALSRRVLLHAHAGLLGSTGLGEMPRRTAARIHHERGRRVTRYGITGSAEFGRRPSSVHSSAMGARAKAVAGTLNLGRSFTSRDLPARGRLR